MPLFHHLLRILHHSSNIIKSLLIFAMLHLSAIGAEYRTVENLLYISGILEMTEINKLMPIVEANDKIDTLVFNNTLGGRVKAAQDFAQYIKKQAVPISRMIP